MIAASRFAGLFGCVLETELREVADLLESAFVLRLLLWLRKVQLVDVCLRDGIHLVLLWGIFVPAAKSIMAWSTQRVNP